MAATAEFFLSAAIRRTHSTSRFPSTATRRTPKMARLPSRAGRAFARVSPASIRRRSAALTVAQGANTPNGSAGAGWTTVVPTEILDAQDGQDDQQRAGNHVASSSVAAVARWVLDGEPGSGRVVSRRAWLQVLLEPLACSGRDLIQDSRFLVERRATGNDVEQDRTPHPHLGPAVQLHDLGIETADEQQRRSFHLRQHGTREIRTPSTRHDRRDITRPRRRRHDCGRGARARTGTGRARGTAAWDDGVPSR